MRRLFRALALFASFSFVALAAPVAAQTQVLTPTAAGGYTSTAQNTAGQFGTPGANIFAGSGGPNTFRSFVIYAVPAGAPITSATLTLNAASVLNGPNTLNVNAVSTSAANVLSGSPGTAAVYADLGDGDVYGTVVASTDEQTLTITLSPAAITALNAARGSSIVFGLTNATDGGGNDWIFGNSTLSPTPRTLTLVRTVTPVPTMSEWMMILLGLMLAGGAALYIQRRQMTA